MLTITYLFDTSGGGVRSDYLSSGVGFKSARALQVAGEYGQWKNSSAEIQCSGTRDVKHGVEGVGTLCTYAEIDKQLTLIFSPFL